MPSVPEASVVPLPCESESRSRRAGSGISLPIHFPFVRVARQDRAVAVDHGRASGLPAAVPRDCASSLSQAKLSAAANHGTDMASVVEHRIAKIDAGLAGDAPDLILADGEVTGLEGASKIAAVARRRSGR